MNTYSLYICNKVIKIESEYRRFIHYCRGYVVQEPAPKPDYTITISKAEVIAQRELFASYGLDISEGFVILRKLSEYLLVTDRILLMHGSVVAYRNNAYMFIADSGVGKTTHSRLWTANLKEAYILNGDKPFISTKEEIIAWGSPWCGSERYNRNEGVRLKAICLLNRAENNSISEISFEEALPLLARQTGDPCSSRLESKFDILEGLYSYKNKIKLYRLDIDNFKDDAFITSYKVLSTL